jgi:hypothetical protein
MQLRMDERYLTISQGMYTGKLGAQLALSPVENPELVLIGL